MVNIIIDGNYLLMARVFALHKNNLLFGELENSLHNSIKTYKNWFPFEKVFIVSDSREKSWRKKLYNDYKGTRKKDTDIDWEFVYAVYNDFKRDIQKPNTLVVEEPHIEGDDWISYISQTENKRGISNIIVSNDHDIKQIINYKTDPLYINVMTNEIYGKQKFFIPENYQIFKDALNKGISDDVFDMNDNQVFLNLLDNFIKNYDVKEINPVEALITKVISGDVSDNILSVYKSDTGRGIGEKGAKTLYDKYITEFGDIDIMDPDLSENIADLICEVKNLSKSNLSDIKKRIDDNMKIINLGLHVIPGAVTKKMESHLKSKL